MNSLQAKVDTNGYHYPINGPPPSYAAPMGHQPLPSYNYERTGYGAMPPSVAPPPLQGQPQFVPYAAVPTQQYGYGQSYPPPPMYNPHHQPNSYERNNHQHPRSHHYGRNNHGSGVSARDRHQPSGNNQNSRFMNTQGGYASHHQEVGHHGHNFQPSRGSYQNWAPRNDTNGPRHYGHHSANQYSLDRRGNGKPMPPPGYNRR